MSADDTTSIANCSFCRGEGLPILPVRYAIARTDSKIPAPRAPVVNGSFGEGVTDVATLPDGQDYTLRLMRAGFLYVYNEAAGTWSGYVVTEKGYLYAYVKEIEHSLLVAMDPANPTQGVSNKLKTPSSKVEFSCAANNSAHQYPGRCITIPDAANADNIYLAFSDTAWTNRVWHEHAINAVIEGTSTHRRDQMRQLSLAAWRGGQASHASSISTISQYVAEASIEELTNKQVKDSIDETGLEFSLYPVNGIADQTYNLVNWAESKSVDGMSAAMMAIEDPVGITADIAALLSLRKQGFHERGDIKRGFEVNTLIRSAEVAVREGAKSDYIKHKMKIASEYIKKDLVIKASQPRSMAQRARDEAYSEKLVDKEFYESEKNRLAEAASSNIMSWELKKAGDKRWSKYEEMLIEGEPQNWLQDVYKRKAVEYQENVMMPLVDAYIEWLKSRKLISSFDSNFDDATAESGEAFCYTLSNCLVEAQEYPKVFKFLKGLLTKNEITQDNLVLRAIGLNLKEIKDAVHEYSAKSREHEKDTYSIRNVSLLPWTAVIATYQNATTNLPNSKAAPSRIIAHVLGPIVSAIDSNASAPLMAMLGMVEGKAIILTKFNGTVSEAIDLHIRQISQLNKKIKNIDSEMLKRKFEVETRGSRRSMKATGNGNFDIKIASDRMSLLNIEGDDPKDILKKASDATIDFRDIDIETNSRNIKYGAFADRNSQLGIVGLALGLWSSWQTAKGLDAHLDVDSTGRFLASLTGAISAAGDFLYAILKRSQEFGGRVITVLGAKLINVAELAGRYFGIIAGLGFAILDYNKGGEYMDMNDYSMGSLYYVSALATSISSIAIFTAGIISSASPVLVATGYFTSAAIGYMIASLLIIGGIFGVVAVLAAIAIYANERNELQKWLHKCFFGKALGHDDLANVADDDLRYKTLAEEKVVFATLFEKVGSS